MRGQVNDNNERINPIRINFNNFWLWVFYTRNHNGTTLRQKTLGTRTKTERKKMIELSASLGVLVILISIVYMGLFL